MATREAHAEIPSTQVRAVELARAGAPDGTRVVACRQTAGRGRLDHRWASPEGGLYLSLIVRDGHPTGSLLPLAAGARLGERLRDAYGVPLAVKWPNDLLVVDPRGPSRKIAGILVDRVASPTLGSAAVVGVGVNVRRTGEGIDPTLGSRVAFLEEFVDPPPQLDALEHEVVREVLHAARDVSEPAAAEGVRRRCEALLYGIGRRAAVDGHPAGRILGIGPDGELMLDTGFDRVAIIGGEVTVAEAG